MAIENKMELTLVGCFQILILKAMVCLDMEEELQAVTLLELRNNNRLLDNFDNYIHLLTVNFIRNN